MKHLIIISLFVLTGCGDDCLLTLGSVDCDINKFNSGINVGRPSEIKLEQDVNQGLRKHLIDLTIKPSQTRVSGSYKK